MTAAGPYAAQLRALRDALDDLATTLRNPPGGDYTDRTCYIDVWDEYADGGETTGDGYEFDLSDLTTLRDLVERELMTLVGPHMMPETGP